MDFVKLQKDAIGVAILKGHSRLSEDFAQEVAMLEIQGRHTHMKNHLVDYLRKEYGDARQACNQARIQATLSPDQLTELNEPTHQDETNDFERLIQSLSPREQAFMNLIHRWGFTLNEVGQTFGVTEGRVSQEVKEINRKIRKAILHPNLAYVSTDGNT